MRVLRIVVVWLTAVVGFGFAGVSAAWGGEAEQRLTVCGRDQQGWRSTGRLCRCRGCTEPRSGLGPRRAT